MYENVDIIVDRSPFSAMIYTKTGTKIMFETVKHLMTEFEKKGISLVLIYVTKAEDEIWKQIQERLVREPWRKEFDENKRSHLKNVLKKYEKITNLDNTTQLLPCNIDAYIKEYVKVKKRIINKIKK